MPIVFDEVVGTVEPETPRGEATQDQARGQSQPDSTSLSLTVVKSILSQLQLRMERLLAD
jgi:hypothetical protein